MKRYKEHFSDEELKRALKGHQEAAVSLLENPGKWEKFRKRFDAFMHKAGDIPVLGPLVDDIVSMAQLAGAYVRKEYRDIPWTSMISVAAALIYVVSPLDLIPDYIPVVGYLDDAAVVLFVLRAGARRDLDKFKAWQESRREEAIRAFAAKMWENIEETMDGAPLAAMVLCDNNMLRVLAESGETQNRPLSPPPPLPVVVHFLHMPVDQLRDLFIEGEAAYLKFLNDMLNEAEVKWSEAGPLAVVSAADFDRYEAYFAILDEDDTNE